MAIAKYILDRFWAKVRIEESGCWIWTASTQTIGYGQFWVGKRRHLSHRLSWELAHNRPIPTGLSVLHHCDRPRCVNPKHLFLGTQKDNIRDASAKERIQHGPKHWMHRMPEKIRRGKEHSQAKLSEEDVRAIRKDTRTQRVIAIAYGIHWMSVFRIKKGLRWAHLK